MTKYQVLVYNPAAQMWRVDQVFATRHDAVRCADVHHKCGRRAKIQPKGVSRA